MAIKRWVFFGGVARYLVASVMVTALASVAVSAWAHLSPNMDAADCTPSSDGQARYFASLRSTTGVDIANGSARLVGTGSANAGQTVDMRNGDLESQASDGSRTPGGPFGPCVPAVNDGHANDIGS